MDNIERGLTATETFAQSDSSSPSQFHSTEIPLRELASVYLDRERTITAYRVRSSASTSASARSVVE